MNPEQGNHLLASLAALYCFVLAAIALQQNLSSRTHRLFAAYNIANGLWNAGDLILLLNNPADWSGLHRIMSLGGIWIMPFVVDFSYELAGLKSERFFRRIIYGLYSVATILSFLSLTPYLNVGALTNGSRGGAGLVEPGPFISRIHDLHADRDAEHYFALHHAFEKNI